MQEPARLYRLCAQAMFRRGKPMPHMSEQSLLDELSDFDTLRSRMRSDLSRAARSAWDCTIHGPRTGTPTKPFAGCTQSWEACRVCGHMCLRAARSRFFPPVVCRCDRCARSLAKPTILVPQQKFPPEIAGKVGLAGGNMVSAMKAIGCVGLISNGPSRDLDEVRPMRSNIC